MREPFTEIQGPPVDLCELSLEMAAIKGGLPQFHTLVVGENLRVFAAQLARKVNATQLGNPLCPYINIEVDPAMNGGSWYLVTPRGNFGSRGY